MLAAELHGPGANNAEPARESLFTGHLSWHIGPRLWLRLANGVLPMLDWFPAPELRALNEGVYGASAWHQHLSATGTVAVEFPAEGRNYPYERCSIHGERRGGPSIS